jgi:hypothetical protein
MITLRGSRKRTAKLSLNIDNSKGGTNRLLDEARISNNEVVNALNLIQVQDGLYKPRWGSQYYGADYGATPDGATEFLKEDQTTELIVVAGGKVYKSTDGGDKTEITGATFTAGTPCYFMQIAGFLYIANGTDPLARYNGTTMTTYTEIDEPTGLTGTATSSIAAVSGTTIYGIVTALNTIGETIGSTEATVKVNKIRDQWNASTDKITWTWNAVSGADRYQLYISDTEGYEELLTSVTETSFTDDGTLQTNPYISVPLDNTTAAPKFKSMVVSGNRIWATNNPVSPYTVYFSGTGQYMGVFSDFYGGGWINLEKGGRETPIKVVHYQSGQGEGRATVLCKTPEGRGAVWQLTISTATVGETSFSVPSAVKIVGSSGTESINGTISTNNDIMFPNRRGWYNLGPQQNFYGLLRTNEISVKIRPYWNSLIGAKLAGICAYFKDAKVFISVPTINSGNNRIIVFDTEKNNWTIDWSLGAKQFLEYTDSAGRTKFLYVPVSGNKLIELSENIGGDLGVAFETSFETGRIALSKEWKDFVKVNKVYIKLGNPRGNINLEVSGTQKNKGFTTIKSKAIVPLSSQTGMGFDLMGDCLMGDTEGVPDTYSDSADIRYLKVNKKIRDIKLKVTSNTYDTDYVIHGFIIDGKPIRTRSPNTWKL